MKNPIEAARCKIKAIANGNTINGTYRQPPGVALASFRRDLLLLLSELERQTK